MPNKKFVEKIKKLIFTLRSSDGDIVYVVLYINEDNVEKAIKDLRKKLIPDENVLIFPDKHKEYIEDRVVFDPYQEGSRQYIWDKGGERVKYERFRVIEWPDGIRDEKKIKNIYKELP